VDLGSPVHPGGLVAGAAGSNAGAEWTGGRGVTTFADALDALRREGVPVLRRKGPSDPPPEAGEMDVWVSERDVARVESILRPLGFRQVHDPQSPDHRFFVCFDAGRWMKLDAKLGDAGSRPRMRWPMRRTGPVVAILGPDGAGKGTVINSLVDAIPLGVVPLSLGMDRREHDGDESHPDAARRDVLRWLRSRRPSTEPLRSMRELAGLGVRLVVAWRRLLPGYFAAWRGHIVLCDRHPIEVLAVRPERTRVGTSFERFAARRLLPWPDAIVVLDAPSDVLFARKPEHPIEVLERWRRGYREAFGEATVLATTGSSEETAAGVSSVVWRAMGIRRGWVRPAEPDHG